MIPAFFDGALIGFFSKAPPGWGKPGAALP